MLIGSRPANLLLGNLSLRANLNNRRALKVSNYIAVLPFGRNNIMYYNILHNQPSLQLLSLVVQHPLNIFIKGDLAPLANALNWINWKNSWLSWHISQNKQLTDVNINEPHLIIDKNKVSLSYGNSRDYITIIDHTNGISNNLIGSYDLAIIGAQLVWKAQLSNYLI